MYAVLNSGPAQRWALASSASCVICVGTFAALQELARRARCNDGAANSFFAGGTSAYALSLIQFKSHQKAFALALATAGAATVGDIGFSALDIPNKFRNTLVSLDFLDAQEEEQQDLPLAKREFTPEELQESWQSMAYYHTGTWRDYLPIRKLSEDEWELYQQKKAQRFQEGIDKITKPPAGRKDG